MHGYELVGQVRAQSQKMARLAFVHQCQKVPESAALGKLDPWTSSLGNGGQSDLEGDVGAFFGKDNQEVQYLQQAMPDDVLVS